MSKITLDNFEKNALIDFLESQSTDKDRILYGLLKEYEEPIHTDYKPTEEERPIKYRSDIERLKNGDHICLNCRYWINNKCTSKLFKNNENLWTMECIAEHYKYWEDKC